MIQDKTVAQLRSRLLLFIKNNFLSLPPVISHIVFLAGEETYEESEKIVKYRKALMRQLHTYVTTSKKGSDKRYSELLLYLPMLYGVNGKMIEELFCQHISAYADIKTILRETIRGFPSSSGRWHNFFNFFLCVYIVGRFLFWFS